MLDLRIIAGDRTLPIFDLPAVIGRHSAARELGDAIDGLMAFLDDLQGDVDLEPEEDRCTAYDDDPQHHADDGLAGDPDDAERTYTEWNTRGRHKLSGGGTEDRSALGGMPGWSVHDDDEDDDPDSGVEDHPSGFDPEEDMCLAGDDRIASGSCTRAMLICEDTGPGDAEDGEREQMLHDVPSLPVYALEPNVSTGSRPNLGLSNLLTSFVSNGHEVRSADTGRIHVATAGGIKPGSPV